MTQPNSDEYQGWTNRETWCVGLWLNNEQGAQEGAQAACRTDGEMIPEAAKTLEDYVDDLLEQQGDLPGFTQDLVNYCLARVNWVELATYFREG